MLIKKKNRKEKNKIGDSNNEIIYDDLDVANTFNEYFHYTITKLGTTEHLEIPLLQIQTALEDPVDNALE